MAQNICVLARNAEKIVIKLTCFFKMVACLKESRLLFGRDFATNF